MNYIKLVTLIILAILFIVNFIKSKKLSYFLLSILPLIAIADEKFILKPSSYNLINNNYFYYLRVVSCFIILVLCVYGYHNIKLKNRDNVYNRNKK